MSKYSERFRKFLQEALDRGLVTKKKLHEVTGKSRVTIDSWLDKKEPSSPGLDSAGEVAEALGLGLDEMIRGTPPKSTKVSEHPVEECGRRWALATLRRAKKPNATLKSSESQERLMDWIEVASIEEIADAARMLVELSERGSVKKAKE